MKTELIKKYGKPTRYEITAETREDKVFIRLLDGHDVVGFGKNAYESVRTDVPYQYVLEFHNKRRPSKKEREWLKNQENA